MSDQCQNPFKWRHFQADTILLCVRWYLHYALSYRDLEEMMLERGLQVDLVNALRSGGSGTNKQDRVDFGDQLVLK